MENLRQKKIFFTELVQNNIFRILNKIQKKKIFEPKIIFFLKGDQRSKKNFAKFI